MSFSARFFCSIHSSEKSNVAARVKEAVVLGVGARM